MVHDKGYTPKMSTVSSTGANASFGRKLIHGGESLVAGPCGVLLRARLGHRRDRGRCRRACRATQRSASAGGIRGGLAADMSCRCRDLGQGSTCSWPGGWIEPC